MAGEGIDVGIGEFLGTHLLPGFQEAIPARLVALADRARHVLPVGRE